MAAVTVIHFGSDECYRIQLLRQVGYEVRESNSLDSLRLEVEGADVDAVIVSEVEPCCAEQAAVLVRQHSGVPLILFRHPDVVIDESRFDRVFSWFNPEAHWLFETAALVMQGKELRAECERLRRELEAVWADSRRLRAQAKAERQRNANAAGPWRLEGG